MTDIAADKQHCRDDADAVRRADEARHTANAALDLASDEAAFVTDAVLEVDGGRTIGR